MILDQAALAASGAEKLTRVTRHAAQVLADAEALAPARGETR